MNKRDIVEFAQSFYEVAEIKEFPHGKMIGIYDEPPSDHIDYLKPSSVEKVFTCNCCIGCGCPRCGLSGFIKD